MPDTACSSPSSSSSSSFLHLLSSCHCSCFCLLKCSETLGVLLLQLSNLLSRGCCLCSSVTPPLSPFLHNSTAQQARLFWATERRKKAAGGLLGSLDPWTSIFVFLLGEMQVLSFLFHNWLLQFLSKCLSKTSQVHQSNFWEVTRINRLVYWWVHREMGCWEMKPGWRSWVMGVCLGRICPPPSFWIPFCSYSPLSCFSSVMSICYAAPVEPANYGLKFLQTLSQNKPFLL